MANSAAGKLTETAAPVAAEHYAAYASSLRYDDLPAHVVTLAKYCLADAVGCAVFGKRFAWSQIVLDEALASGGNGRCSVPGSSAKLDAAKAALVMGAMAHSFELDSLRKPGAGVHPGATVAVPALAVAQAQGASGRDLITAIVAGTEILFRIGAATLHSAEKLGFHAPGITGVFGAAAASAMLMKLNPAQTANAFGVAGSMGGGLLAFAKAGSGGMVKRLHLGRAAESGVIAARLASRGYEGPLNILEGKFGVLDAYCEASDASLLTKGLGQSFDIEKTCFKRYACHVTAHAPVQLLRGWMDARGFSGADIAAIELDMSDKVVSHHAGAEAPDIMMAQYRVAVTTAISAYFDPNDPRVFSDDVIRDRRVLDLARRVVLREKKGLPNSWAGTMKVRLANGESFEGELSAFLGSPETPFTEEALRVKFDRLVQDETPQMRGGLFSALMSLERCADVTELKLS